MLVYLCPADRKYQCSWEGHCEDIIAHFENEHDHLLHYTENFDIDLETPSENRIFLIEEEVYLTQIAIKDAKLILKLRYLGPLEYAKRITYNIKLLAQDKVCQADLVKVTPEGFLEVDLKEINSIYNGVQVMVCSLKISKCFQSDTFEKVKPSSEVISHKNKQIEKTNAKQREDDSVFTTVETDLADNINPEEMLVVRNKLDRLGRSHSAATEYQNRRYLRAKSTLSLDAVPEIDKFCVGCRVFLNSSIYWCPNGHHFCEKCQRNICCVCHETVSSINDDQLQNIPKKYTLMQCQFLKYGCPEKIFSHELRQHEIYCLFCVYSCPIDGCHFQSAFKGLCSHLKLIHSSTKLLSGLILSFSKHKEAFLANEERGIFYVQAKYEGDIASWTVQFCGPKERNFFCELKFKDAKLKQPLLLKKIESTYKLQKSISQLKDNKIKAKNAILTISG